MRLLDVNVVLAAHRQDHPHYERSRPWLEQALDSGVTFSVIDSVAGSFLRVATSRRIFTVPSPVNEAFAFLRALRGHPAHILIAPGPRHLDLLQTLCEDLDVAGDLLPDAQLAAIAIEHACELVSFDRDFARFPDLRWTRP